MGADNFLYASAAPGARRTSGYIMARLDASRNGPAGWRPNNPNEEYAIPHWGLASPNQAKPASLRNPARLARRVRPAGRGPSRRKRRSEAQLSQMFFASYVSFGPLGSR